jgi:hypothetical protein
LVRIPAFLILTNCRKNFKRREQTGEQKNLKSDYVDKEGTLVTLNVSERTRQSMSGHRAGLVFRILFFNNEAKRFMSRNSE